jgi:hypothetical protein
LSSLSLVDEIDIWAKFHQHFRTTFSLEQDEKLLMANGVWQIMHSFGKQLTSLAIGAQI